MMKSIRFRSEPIIEKMESRLLMSAAYPSAGSNIATDSITSPQVVIAQPMNLSVAVVSTTLPSAVVAGVQLLGSVTISVTNLAGTKASGPVTLSLYAAPHGVIDSSAVSLVSVMKSLSLQSGLAKTFTLPIKALPVSLASHTYTLLAKTADSLNNVAVSATGPHVIVSAPFLEFSETELAKNLPLAAVGGVNTPALMIVTLTNFGNVASSKPTIVDIFASTNGVIDNNSVLIGGVSKNVKIKPGKFSLVSVKFGSFPNVPHNTYELIAQVTDENGAVTTAPSTASVVIAPPFVALTSSMTTPRISKPHNAGSTTITATSNVQLTNTGNGASTGVTIALYVSPDNSTTVARSAAVPFKTFTTAAVIKPLQNKKLVFQSSIPSSSSHTLVFIVAKITDSLGNVTYAVDPQGKDLFV